MPNSQSSFGDGEVVRLKSGGPDMTVQIPSALAPGGTTDSSLAAGARLMCCWLNDQGEATGSYFYPAMLESVDAVKLRDSGLAG
jgi:uncharacterized protein YodC (DUF2158 family)